MKMSVLKAAWGGTPVRKASRRTGSRLGTHIRITRPSRVRTLNQKAPSVSGSSCVASITPPGGASFQDSALGASFVMFNLASKNGPGEPDP